MCRARVPGERVWPTGDVLPRNHLVVYVEDADRTDEGLGKQGVGFVAPPATRPDGERFAFFEDPEGNLGAISLTPG